MRFILKTISKSKYLMICFLSCSLSGIAFGTDLTLDHEWLRIRLEQNLSSLQLEGKGLQIQGEAALAEFVAVRHDEESVQISRVQKNKSWFWQVVVQRPFRNPDILWIGSPLLTIRGENLRHAGKTLPNMLILSGRKSFSLIAGVSLESYLMGVLSKEMPVGWPIEALKAQAIASRSYALAVMREHPHRSYYLEASTMDQAYENFSAESLSNPQMQKVVRAVKETAGVVLINKKQQVIKAFYHADCGGRTSSSEAVFGIKGLAGGAIDSSCPLNPKARWSYQISREQLAQRMKRYFHAPDEFLRITGLELKHMASDERVDEVVVALEDGEKVGIKANEFRDLLGFQDLRSARFQVQENEKKFTFVGTGFGHGVGLCQWGSRLLANHGARFSQILTHYYPEADLKSPKDFYSEKTDGHQDQHMFN